MILRLTRSLLSIVPEHIADGVKHIVSFKDMTTGQHRKLYVENNKGNYIIHFCLSNLCVDTVQAIRKEMMYEEVSENESFFDQLSD
ncbi:hypothetical protein CI610_01920 [invertebrate metagenome]|uniref:Uncharacterized protein n=1 Tax=invertebrate metagenome TaxID=1711999 RepID=A0A2H9T7C1_9ZZZZ